MERAWREGTKKLKAQKLIDLWPDRDLQKDKSLELNAFYFGQG